MKHLKIVVNGGNGAKTRDLILDMFIILYLVMPNSCSLSIYLYISFVRDGQLGHESSIRALEPIKTRCFSAYMIIFQSQNDSNKDQIESHTVKE